MILDEAFPFIEPLVANNIPDGRGGLDGLTCLLGFDDQFSLQLSSLLHCFQLFARHVGRAVCQISVESDRFELETFDADDVSTFLSLATGCAEPVLVSEEEVL